MYKVEISKKANKEFEKIPKLYFDKILNILDSLKNDPYLGKALVGELKGWYSIRAWPYRIIYEIHKDKLIINIIKIGHRKDVYK